MEFSKFFLALGRKAVLECGVIPVRVICSICGKSLQETAIRGVNSDNKVYDVAFCGDCKLGVTVPLPVKEDLEKLYSLGNYRSDGGRRFNALVESFIYLSRLWRKRRIKKYVKNGRILDIGCGRGLALEVMRRDGWEVAGVEFSRETAAYISETYGIHVVSGDPGEWGFSDGFFDVITINHVLEHLTTPSLMLDACGRLLRKGGLLVCAVPDISSLQALAGKGKWFHLDIPFHIHHFTEAGLARLLEGKGFKIVNIRRMDLEYNPFGWLQTLLNISGIRKNLLYSLLKSRELRKKELATATAGDVFLTFFLLPFYLPLALVLSFYESYVLKKGGTVALYAERAAER